MVRYPVLFFFILFFFQILSQKSFAAGELLVKADSLAIAGYSAISDDKSVIYGGIAGAACAGDGSTTCNSCTDTAGAGINACNQASIYSALNFSISFKVTKNVTGIAKLFVEGSTAGDYSTAVVSLASATYTADSTVVTLSTTWGDICSAAGLGANCEGSGGVAYLATKGLRFGVDSDASGDVDEDERKSLTIKLHYIPVGATDVTQASCSGGGSGIGVCDLTFLPGDEKIYIDSASYKGDDTSSTSSGGSISWESIALFPIPVQLGGEIAVYSSFLNGAVSPIIVTIDPTTGDIPDSQIKGDLSNYNKYCIVYATKNKAQNIYKYVTSGIDTNKSCVTPAEVAGILDDKSCFISTAAFGSSSAPEVKIFRKFRNKFLLTNDLGKLFVKFYYAISPPIADFISENIFLKTLTRILLYPLLIFAIVSLKIGFFWTFLFLIIALLVLFRWRSHLRSKKTGILIFIIVGAVSFDTKAETKSNEVEITHPLAKEGLVRITKEGTYIYDKERPLKKESGRISFGQANHPEITLLIQPVDVNNNPAGPEKEFEFADLYDESSGMILGYDYEWFTHTQKGKLGLQGGVSLMFASGHGRLKADPNDPSVEAFTFVTMPITLGGVYRLEWKDKQLFAPYAAGGGTLVVLAEKREDKAVPDFIGGIGFYAAGGVLFNLSTLDRDAGFQLESEYGISNMWLSLEYRLIEANNEAFTFSNQYINAGLSIDF